MTGPSPPSPEDVELLLPFVHPDRIGRMDAVLDHRTRNFTVVLEDFYDPHNMSAVLRSADAFGVQDVHVVEGEQARGRFNPNHAVATGAERWLSVHTWPTPADCIEALRHRGYALVAAVVGAENSLSDLDFSQPTALLLGNEHEGLSEAMIEAADTLFRIPMVGFVESFNVSVAAAICLHSAYRQREERVPGGHGDLSEADRESLRTQWIYKDVRNAPTVLAELKRRQESGKQSEESLG